MATLDAVLDHYAAGGRVIASGPNAGDGRRSPHKSELVPGFRLTAEQKRDLLAFLDSLTDRAFLTNPAFADPFHE
jgi:cytochrome c peroxidase